MESYSPTLNSPLDFNDNSNPNPKRRRISSQPEMNNSTQPEVNNLTSLPEIVTIRTRSNTRMNVSKKFALNESKDFKMNESKEFKMSESKEIKMIDSKQFGLVVLRGDKCSFCSFWATVPELVDAHVSLSHPEQTKRYFVLKSLKSKPKSVNINSNHNNNKNNNNNNNNNDNNKNNINNNNNNNRSEQNMDLMCLKKLSKSQYWKTRPESSNRRRHKCHRCIQSFDARKDYHRHLHQTESPENLFVCQICRERFESRPSLVRHLGHDHHPDQLRCQVCRRPTESCVDKHADYLYSVQDKIYDCPVCEIQFRKKSSLKKHMRGY